MVFSQNITPTRLDVRWGADFHARVDMFQHPTRLPSGNPVMVYRHGGGGWLYDKRLPWTALGTFNVLANWLMQQSELPFDFWSVGSPQYDWSAPIPSGHLPTTRPEPLTRAVVFPENVEWLKTFYQWANRHALGGQIVPELGTDLGHTKGDYIGLGSSFGTLMQTTAQFSGPRVPGTTNAVIAPGGRFGPYAGGGGVKGLLLFAALLDIRTLAGLDQIYQGHLTGLYGTHSQGQWNRVPTWMKAAFSPLAYLEAGQTRYAVPHYIVHEQVGNGLKPYGDPATGAGNDPHDAAMNAPWIAALTAAGIPAVGEVVPLGDWETEVAGAALSQRVLTWARGVLNR